MDLELVFGKCFLWKLHIYCGIVIRTSTIEEKKDRQTWFFPKTNILINPRQNSRKNITGNTKYMRRDWKIVTRSQKSKARFRKFYTGLKNYSPPRKSFGQTPYMNADDRKIMLLLKTFADFEGNRSDSKYIRPPMKKRVRLQKFRRKPKKSRQNL